MKNDQSNILPSLEHRQTPLMGFAFMIKVLNIIEFGLIIFLMYPTGYLLVFPGDGRRRSSIW